jgi:hypothetical protein
MIPSKDRASAAIKDI